MSCRYSVRRWQWCFSASSRNSFMSSALHWCWPAFISPRASRRPSADLRPRTWQLGRGTRPRSWRRMSCPAWQQFAPQSCFDKFPGHMVPELLAEPKHQSPLRWLSNQPYLLLSLTSLFWAGNIVLARYVAGHVPPLTLSCVRWIGVSLILMPFAWPHLKRDWPTLLTHLPMMLLLSATGFAYNNAVSYWAMQYTQALNALF